VTPSVTAPGHTNRSDATAPVRHPQYDL